MSFPGSGAIGGPKLALVVSEVLRVLNVLRRPKLKVRRLISVVLIPKRFNFSSFFVRVFLLNTYHKNVLRAH